ncbi:MAG: cyclic nucleotide-binding domain-containing protein, partial [Gammaproteobacteria bacterium]|nr:cyclic nucleotide-binding domain-containing protein [Gammaproteobacteria bacterium]
MSLMLDHHKKFEHLRESEFLKSASEDMIRLLADQVETLHIPAEYRIFKRGDVGLSMYIVVDGSVRVHDDDVVIKHLQQGDIFGEIGALASEARTASVTADTDSTLYELGQNTLYHAINTYPDTAKEIITALCKKESL